MWRRDCGNRNEMDQLKNVDLDQALRGQEKELGSEYGENVKKIQARIAEMEKLANENTINIRELEEQANSNYALIDKTYSRENNLGHCKQRCKNWNKNWNNKADPNAEVCVAIGWQYNPGAGQPSAGDCYMQSKKCPPSDYIADRDVDFRQWVTLDMDVDPREVCGDFVDKNLCNDVGDTCTAYCNTKETRGRIPTYRVVKSGERMTHNKIDGCVVGFNLEGNCEDGPFYSDTDHLEWATHTFEHECETQCNDNCDCTGYTWYKEGNYGGKNCKLLKYEEGDLDMKKSLGELKIRTVTKIQDKDEHYWCKWAPQFGWCDKWENIRTEFCPKSCQESTWKNQCSSSQA